MDVQVIGFDQLKKDYPSCKDFVVIYADIAAGQHADYADFYVHDGYLFKESLLCLPKTSLREQVILELHAGGAAGHFGLDKTIYMAESRFYWPSLKRDVAKIV